MRIGIVMPACNAAAWIGDAIASVIAQTHRDWVLVVVDDGSSDGTGGVVAGFADPRMMQVRQENAGVSAARNRGVAELVGSSATPTLTRCAEEGWGGSAPDSLLFLDADDALAPDALFRLSAALTASPQAVAAVGAYTLAHTGRVRHPPSGDLLPRLLVRNWFANGGHVLLRRAAVEAAGGFLPGIAYGEDWEYWIRIALQGPFVAARGPAVLHVRQHPAGAYQRLAADPAAFAPCMDAIFANATLRARFGATWLAAIRRRTEAENNWIIGRELIRHGRTAEGRTRLRRSVRSAPSLKRLVLLAAAHLLALLPVRVRGPFQPYRPTACAPVRASDPA